MSPVPLHTTATRRGNGAGAGARALSAAEYEFQRLTLPREFSRNVVTRLLVERAEHGGWELERTRVLPDGTRKVVLRRRIIRQPRPAYLP